MTARPKFHTEIRYQFGFMSPARRPELVVCTSLDEARFFVREGGKLMMREIQTRIGEWTEVPS